MTKPEIIFFGSGPLADYTVSILKNSFDIIFHARSKEDLITVKSLKSSHLQAFGILASFGVLIKSDVLELFEPVGILNLHPSLLPKYRGPSPIETAILRGDTTFGVSIMKLVKAMDAGPLYFQKSINFSLSASKDQIYQDLAAAGAHWLCQNAENLSSLPAPKPQDDSLATFCQKFDKSMSTLDPLSKTAPELNNEIRAFLGFPKSKYQVAGLDCTIIKSTPVDHIDKKTFLINADSAKNTAPRINTNGAPANSATPKSAIAKPLKPSALALKCKNSTYLLLEELQPAGRKIMDAKSFINGYLK